MSLLGKIFAILNIIAAAAFVVIAGMDYAQRHRWAYAVYRHQLLLDGLPIDESEKDADGKPRTEPFDETWFTEMFQRAGGNPVKTQQQEVQSLQRTVQSRIESTDPKDTATRTQRLARYVNALAQTYAQRKAAVRQMGEAGTSTNDSSADLSAAYASVLDARGMTQGGHDIVKGIREKAGEPNPRAGEIAARVPFGKQPEDKRLIELQFGRDTATLVLAPEVQLAPRPGAEVFITLPATTADKLQAILDGQFAAAGQGSPGKRKADAARLMFCLGEALHDESTGDYYASPAYQRLVIVAGLGTAAQAIDSQAMTYQRMIQDILSDANRLYLGAAMGDHEADLRRFIAEHNAIVNNNISLAEAAEQLERMLKAKNEDLDRQKLLIDKRETEIKALQKRLADANQSTAEKLATQAKAEQEVRDRLIELRDTGRINQNLERDIRKLEEELSR